VCLLHPLFLSDVFSDVIDVTSNYSADTALSNCQRNFAYMLNARVFYGRKFETFLMSQPVYVGNINIKRLFSDCSISCYLTASFYMNTAAIVRLMLLYKLRWRYIAANAYVILSVVCLTFVHRTESVTATKCIR